MRVHFTTHGWEIDQYWLENDVAMLIRDARRSPFAGIGKPEPLKRQLSGWWSRRISGEHPLGLSVEGKAGADQRLEIMMCRNHFE